MSTPQPPTVVELPLGEETFRLRWTFGALAIFQRLTGVSASNEKLPNVTHENMIHALYAAIAADAQSRDAPPPITEGRLGSLMDSGVKVRRAMEALGSVIEAYHTRTEAEEASETGKELPPAAEANGKIGSAASTRSARSTSRSKKKSSGGSRSTTSTRASSAT